MWCNQSYWIHRPLMTSFSCIYRWEWETLNEPTIRKTNPKIWPQSQYWPIQYLFSRRHYRYNSSPHTLIQLCLCDSSVKFVLVVTHWYHSCCLRSLVPGRQSAVSHPPQLRHREHQERGGPGHQAEAAVRVLGRDAGAPGAPRLAPAPGDPGSRAPPPPRVTRPWSPAPGPSAETEEHQPGLGGQAGGQGPGTDDRGQI